MSWGISITFSQNAVDRESTLTHRVRNFGEFLYRHFREHGHGSVSLEEVDQAIITLKVENVSTRRLKRTKQQLIKFAEVDFPDCTPEITVEKTGS